jgi:hypothetical protein
MIMNSNNRNNGMTRNSLLAFSLLLGLGAVVTACDDDDGGGTNLADVGLGGTLGTAGAGGTGSGGSGGGNSGGTAGTQGDASVDAIGDAGPVAILPRGAANPPTLGVQIDRMGRPAIATALVGTFDGNDTSKKATKDTYNTALIATWGTFSPEIKKNLAILDSLDGNCGNQFAANQSGARYSFLAGVLADDRLYLNAQSGTCGVYLGVEAGLVLGAGAPANVSASCGGRTPNDDVIERSYSVLAAGVLSGVDDTIGSDADTTHDLAVFPWLSAPK